MVELPYFCTMEFAEHIGSRQSAEIQRETRRLEKELFTMRRRSAELDAIFKKLYEDRVLDCISVEQFQMLSSSYTEEQVILTVGTEEKEAAIQKLKESASNTDRFIAKAKRYTDITELAPELLRLFIQKIMVHKKSVKYSKHAEQTVEIHYTYWLYQWKHSAKPGKPPAGSFSVIPAGAFPR